MLLFNKPGLHRRALGSAACGEISIYIVPCAVRAVSTAEVLERPGELTCVADLMS